MHVFVRPTATATDLRLGSRPAYTVPDVLLLMRVHNIHHVYAMCNGELRDPFDITAGRIDPEVYAHPLG